MFTITPSSTVLALSEAQRGVIARHQILRQLSETYTDDLLRSGWYERILRGVYRVAGGPRLAEQLAFAAALRSRPHAVVTGPLALGLLDVGRFTTDAPFAVLRAADRRLSGVTFPHRPDPDPSRAVTTYGEVRVAGPLDALIDSALFLGQISERDLRVAWDDLRGDGLVSIDRLRRRCAQLRDLTPAVTALELVLDLATIEMESEGERALDPILSCFEPAFERQVWVIPRRRLDFFSRRCRQGYEYLGEVDHAYVAERIADDERDGEMRRANVHVGYVTKHDLREPRTLMGTIAATLTVRAHELGVLPPVAVRPLPS